MDEIIPAFDPSKNLKSYSRMEKTCKEPIEKCNTTVRVQTPLRDVVKREPLTTKDAVKYLLEGSLKSKVCRYCLNIAPDLSELDKILQVADKETLYKVSIKDMIASFHPFKVEDDPNFPDKICEKCLDRTLSAYLFTQQCEQAERALRNCFEDMYEKLDKLDPLERPTKRGRQKLNPNYNVLHTEHEKVINYADPIIHIVNTATEPLTEQNAINEFECLKCCEVLPNLESLLKHSKIHPKSMWYNCRLCGMSFPKQHHLKKHFRNNHSPKTVPASSEKPSASKFDCKMCGIIIEDYYKYLQHIEKHKFKVVMEHLVERKMDKLCSLCFNKEDSMVQLDKIICLHGGCPELTGDRSLYTVLDSTLPEKKNKFQELLVPTQASIIQIIKKKNESEKGNNLVYSNPTVLTVEAFDCNDNYLFFFSEPKMNSAKIIEINDSETSIDEDDIESSEISMQIVNQKIGGATSPVVTMAKDIESVEFDRNIQLPEALVAIEMDQPKTSDQCVNYTFSIPDFVKYENEGSKNNQLEKIEESKGDLIFDKLSNNNIDDIKTGVSILTEDIQNNTETMESQLCNYCSVFKYLSKCDHCKNNNDLPHEFSNEVTETHFETSLTTNKVQKIDYNTKTSANDTATDKSTWQCNVCLINNNKNKEICDCCEAKPLLDIPGSTFKLQKNIGNRIDTKIDLNKSSVLETNTLVKLQTPSSFDFQINKIPVDNKTSNNNKVYSIQPKEISPMETEIIVTENHNNLSVPIIVNANRQEAMEVEEIQMLEELTIGFPNREMNVTDTVFNYTTNLTAVTRNETPLTINNNTFTNNQFQFAIGSGEKGPRKYKRAQRNMTRAFHK